MTPLEISCHALGAEDIFPSDAELAARCRTPKDALPEGVDEAIRRISEVASPAVCFACGKVDAELDRLLGLSETPTLSTPLVALLAVTLGYGVDRLIESERHRGIASAYLLDAVASAMAEAAADAADAMIRKKYPHISFAKRLSPGYGRLSLSLQAPLISLLGADKRLGLRLDESYLMHPRKSITAILGGRDEN